MLSLQLLTMPGTWVTSDQAEMIFTARRLLAVGRFDFADAGQKVPVLPWLLAEPGKPPKPRLFPGTPLALAPLVALDRMLGLDTTPDLGTIVHLEGPLFVALALLMIGLALRHGGASDRATVVAVLIAGSAWPIWQVSRRAGAEPLLAVLVAAFLLASARRRVRVQGVLVFALPWCHPTGSLMAPALALGEAFLPEAGNESRRNAWMRAGRLLAAALAGTASTALVWNGWYHGSLGGGYALYGVLGAVLRMSPLQVAAFYLKESFLHVPLLLMLCGAAAMAGGREGRKQFVVPLVLLTLHMLLFSYYSNSFLIEPARRLAVVWLTFGFALGGTFDRLRLSEKTSAVLVLLSLLSGVYWYRLVEANYYVWPDGSYEPLVWWITLAVAGGTTALWAGPIVALACVAAFAAFRLGRAFAPAKNGIE